MRSTWVSPRAKAEREDRERYAAFDVLIDLALKDEVSFDGAVSIFELMYPRPSDDVPLPGLEDVGGA